MMTKSTAGKKTVSASNGVLTVSASQYPAPSVTKPKAARGHFVLGSRSPSFSLRSNAMGSVRQTLMTS